MLWQPGCCAPTIMRQFIDKCNTPGCQKLSPISNNRSIEQSLCQPSLSNKSCCITLSAKTHWRCQGFQQKPSTTTISSRSEVSSTIKHVVKALKHMVAARCRKTCQRTRPVAISTTALGAAVVLMSPNVLREPSGNHSPCAVE